MQGPVLGADVSHPGEKPSWTILIVEDDASVRRVVARIVHSAGHTAIQADNGLAALRALDSGPVDLVVTDVVMPDMEGLELVRQIRKRPHRPRIIVVSGGGRALAGSYLEMARDFGADGTLSKPLVMAELLALIDQLMAT
jgi:CheY-like chemotaxis protein